jgi:hypothetical protein
MLLALSYKFGGHVGERGGRADLSHLIIVSPSVVGFVMSATYLRWPNGKIFNTRHLRYK